MDEQVGNGATAPECEEHPGVPAFVAAAGADE